MGKCEKCHSLEVELRDIRHASRYCDSSSVRLVDYIGALREVADMRSASEAMAEAYRTAWYLLSLREQKRTLDAMLSEPSLAKHAAVINPKYAEALQKEAEDGKS